MEYLRLLLPDDWIPQGPGLVSMRAIGELGPGLVSMRAIGERGPGLVSMRAIGELGPGLGWPPWLVGSM